MTATASQPWILRCGRLTTQTRNHLVIVCASSAAKYFIGNSCVILDYVGQSQKASFEVHQGNDSNNNPWIGLTMSETVRLIIVAYTWIIYWCLTKYEGTGQFFQQWWFLRDGEPGYHTFTRLQFDNGTEGIDLGNLQEFRQVVSTSSRRLYLLCPSA